MGAADDVSNRDGSLAVGESDGQGLGKTGRAEVGPSCLGFADEVVFCAGVDERGGLGVVDGARQVEAPAWPGGRRPGDRGGG